VVTINAGVVVTITGVTIENGAGNITLPASVPTNPTDKSGRRVVELGAGVMLSYEELIGSSLRATGEQVITNVTFRHNSQKISVSLKAAGGYQRAADEIQAFIHRFQPDVPYSPGA
jgi:UDP:flavonoid glycosyltransferase YjiC (YdhE family)